MLFTVTQRKHDYVIYSYTTETYVTYSYTMEPYVIYSYTTNICGWVTSSLYVLYCTTDHVQMNEAAISTEVIVLWAED